ncbi:MAG: hypothetical protein KKA73_20855 [Chloroflexi bacterium]|nr:hypothetical protein [Chloroflexota bacterium]MBU1750142.1 hypothetical protein [Chloroflexota bacterium]
MLDSQIAKEILDLIRTRWHRRSTLLLLILLASITMLALFSAIDLDKLSTAELGLAILVFIAIALFWYYSTRLPKTAKGKIGFAVAIATETTEQEDRIAKDFVMTLRTLLDNSNLKYSFSFIEFPQYYAQKIKDSETALEHLRKSRCHFMIYGRARTRHIQAEDRYVLNMEGIVAHSPIPQEIQKGLSAEFTDLLPRKIVISSENDLFSFEFTAEWVNLVAKYIIGIAAMLSADIEYAQSLFEDLQQEASRLQTDLPAVVKIRQRTPDRLATTYSVQAIKCYREWRTTKDLQTLDRMKSYLDHLSLVAPGDNSGRVLHAIWYLVKNHDTTEAKRELERCRTSERDVVWDYNYAFLLAYEGDMQGAFKRYKRASHEHCADPRVLLDIEEFICWILEKEPDKVQLYFCLGLLNLFSKGDWARALQDLEKFLEVAPPTQFSREIQLAEKYITDIKIEYS